MVRIHLHPKHSPRCEPNGSLNAYIESAFPFNNYYKFSIDFMEDKVFSDEKKFITDFEFNQDVVNVFNDMAKRSIPYYDEVLSMGAQIARNFYQESDIIYDLGCSTGNLLVYLKKEFDNEPFRYCGIDNSKAMIAKARENFLLDHNPGHGQFEFLKKDILNFFLEKTSVIAANYVLQFLRPLERSAFLRKIYSALKPGGVLIISEKMLESNSDSSRLFNRLYYNFKKSNGYSELEISQKRESLENVLIPYRMDENIHLLKESGFDQVDLFFKWFNFGSFIATKKP